MSQTKFKNLQEVADYFKQHDFETILDDDDLTIYSSRGYMNSSLTSRLYDIPDGYRFSICGTSECYFGIYIFRS